MVGLSRSPLGNYKLTPITLRAFPIFDVFLCLWLIIMDMGDCISDFDRTAFIPVA